MIINLRDCLEVLWWRWECWEWEQALNRCGVCVCVCVCVRGSSRNKYLSNIKGLAFRKSEKR